MQHQLLALSHIVQGPSYPAPPYANKFLGQYILAPALSSSSAISHQFQCPPGWTHRNCSHFGKTNDSIIMIINCKAPSKALTMSNIFQYVRHGNLSEASFITQMPKDWNYWSSFRFPEGRYLTLLTNCQIFQRRYIFAICHLICF